MAPFREWRRGKNGEKILLPKWRGVVVTSGKRRKVTLFSDKKVSARELVRLQKEADAETQDGLAVRRRKHGTRPIGEHIADYVAHIGAISKSADHRRISEFMVKRLVEKAEWKRLADISLESVEAALKAVGEAGGTVAYQNSFVKRAKAFVNWLVPERLAIDPLQKLRRRSEVRAERNRARRAGSDQEIAALMHVLPESFHLAVCLPLLGGFRRHEAEQLRWGDMRLSGAIPFVQLRPEWTKNSKVDALPLHPVLAQLLGQQTEGMPQARVLASVPDVATLKKYLERSGGIFKVGGKRLDYHALRHTFATNLDRTGSSETSKRRLLRHSVRDVTGGYSHAELAELYAVVCRLPSPFGIAERQAMKLTGTDGVAGKIGGAPVEQKKCGLVQSDALPCTLPSGGENIKNAEFSAEKQNNLTAVHSPALPQLMMAASGDILSETRPSTQVD